MSLAAQLMIRLPPHYGEKRRRRSRIERALANEIALDRIGTLKPERKRAVAEAFRLTGELTT